MIQARWYQSEAVDALRAGLRRPDVNPLAVIPTGGGKSIIIARLFETADANFQAKLGRPLRALCLTHVQELVGQNALECLEAWPDVEGRLGVYCASVPRSKLDQIGVANAKTVGDITFASVQSAAKHPEVFGSVDLVFIDEAHRVPKRGESMYMGLLDALREANPKLRVGGCTATPDRLDGGHICKGKKRIFSEVVYDLPPQTLINEGYLSTLVSHEIGDDLAKLDTEGVGRVGHDFNEGQLAAAVDTDGINEAIIREMIRVGQRRAGWMLFAVTIEHAEHLTERLVRHGINARAIHQNVPKGLRAQWVEQFKKREIQCLVNVNVLTTGFNAKHVDLLAMARPTMSRSLYVQMMGRGMRALYAPGMPIDTVEQRLEAIELSGKPYCLVLDFARNIERHGPIDGTLEVGGYEESEKPLPVRTCQNDACGAKFPVALTVCPACGTPYIVAQREDPANKLESEAGRGAILKRDAVDPSPEFLDVRAVSYEVREKNLGPYLVARYDLANRVKIWETIAPDREGQAGNIAKGWVDRRLGKDWRSAHRGTPLTQLLYRAIEAGEALQPVRIRPRRNGDFWRVGSVELTEEPISPADHNKELAADGPRVAFAS